MFVDFFIKRPVFTSVCAIIFLLLGAISIPTLPAARFPEIAPTQINVTATYAGASAEVVENTVTTVLEREINGVEGMRYIDSSSTNTGNSTIRVVFDSSRSRDIAAVDVQNRVALAEPILPEEVQRTGVSVTRQSNDIVLAFGLYTENNQYNNIFISNYADLYLVDALQRVPGVSEARIFGERRYAMRLWLDPNKLASRNLTAQDVVDAVGRQNLQVGAGQIGQPPTADGQMYQIDLEAVSRLVDPAEFDNIIVQRNADGTLVKVKDVGRAELGAETYSSFFRFRGQDGVGIGIYPIPGSNALEVARGVRAAMERLVRNFPPGLQYQVAFDTTLFVEESLNEVLQSLIEAVVLVILVIFLFLQDWRTTLIPVITIPLSLIGTFAFVKAFGFSLNTLTLFGLTLATGMVVDDAIVVVENVARLIQDEGMPPRQAAAESMRELTGAVIATSLVLMAVFVPVAFFPGSTGQIYRQFALTIAFSVAISTFLALTLTPSLSALLLRQRPQPRGIQGWFFGAINWFLNGLQRGYERSLWYLTRVKAIVVLLFIASLGLTAWLYQTVPTAFLPEEDQGRIFTIVQAPQGVSFNYTSEVMNQAEQEILKLPEVESTFVNGGFSFGNGTTANSGVIFTNLKPWDERSGPGQSAAALISKLRSTLSAIPKARIVPRNPPAILGLGSFSGFQFYLEDRAGNSGLDNLVQVMRELTERGNQTPQLESVLSTFAANAPKMQIEVDRDKAEALQVDVDDVFNTLQSYIGSRYVNDFNLQGRTYRVYVQADAQFRSNPEDVGKLYVRSATNQMIPLSNLVRMTPTTGAQVINHHNLFRAIEITGSAAEGYSSGQAIEAMEQLAAEVLPQSMGYEWSGVALEEQESGGQAPIIFALGLVFVFLVLAAQYENYVDPLIIMLAVPLAIFGALLSQSLRGLNNDVFCQVGLVMLIGLASKNAILIVEFANQLREQGLSLTKAAVEASQQRLRPILMTAISNLVGIWPLAVATGAGAASRQSLGTSVFGGMLTATILTLFVVPVLYIVIGNVRDRFQSSHKSHRFAVEPTTQREPVERNL
ncbi:MAG: efflux RND transporter permease subunit [Chroococcidiopsis sp.]